MIKRFAILASFMTWLIGTLVYSISPGEVQIAYAAFKSKVSDAFMHLLSSLHLSALGARPVAADPPAATLAGAIWVWFHRPEMLLFLPVAGAVVWLGRRARTKPVQSVEDGAAEVTPPDTNSKDNL